MKLLLSVLFLASVASVALGQQVSFRPGVWQETLEPRVSPKQSDVGEPLYLTEFLEAGDPDGARAASEVTEALPGFSAGDWESYAGFITVDADTDSHMFFWFFPATGVDPATAPVVVWLQGGPGSSSMFGLFEIHGPISAVEGGEDGVTGVENPYAWTNVANMIYIDQPVGTGFSNTDGKFVEDEDQVAADLYEFINQWFAIFPDFQSNDFFVFGESYGGKYVPAFSYKIHTENQNDPALSINLRGLAVGNGAMSPPDSFVYGQYLWELGLVDSLTRDSLLEDEAELQRLAAEGDYVGAFNVWNDEIGEFLFQMGCSYYLDFQECREPPEETDYADYVNLDQTRSAIHVGDTCFGCQSGAVYNALTGDIIVSQRETVEALLEEYPVMFYNGNNDIICHHTAVMEMFFAMENWSAKDEFLVTPSEIYRVDGETAAYLRSVANLRLVAIRNASHMAPRSQPVVALDIFTKFLDGSL